MPSFDEALIEKYIKVMALAERGEAGEQQSARSRIQKMEAQNPGLRGAVEAYLRAKAQEAKQQEQEQQHQYQHQQQSPHHNPYQYQQQQQQQQQQQRQQQQQQQSRQQSRSGFPFGGNWEQIFQYASSFWGSAQNFAQDVTDTAEAIEIANEVELTTKLTSAQNVIIAFRMPAEIMEYAMTLTPIQQAAFRQRLHSMLDEEFDAIFDTEN